MLRKVLFYLVSTINRTLELFHLNLFWKPLLKEKLVVWVKFFFFLRLIFYFQFQWVHMLFYLKVLLLQFVVLFLQFLLFINYLNLFLVYWYRLLTFSWSKISLLKFLTVLSQCLRSIWCGLNILKLCYRIKDIRFLFIHFQNIWPY